MYTIYLILDCLKNILETIIEVYKIIYIPKCCLRMYQTFSFVVYQGFLSLGWGFQKYSKLPAQMFIFRFIINRAFNDD
jgi:hypothetical protein